MSSIFVVSDTHFNHKNILNFEDGHHIKFRGELFDSAEHMNETMIENWNRVITPQDIVYHLGDVYFGAQKEADNILSRLNGKKRLVLGNHDDGKDSVLQKHFQKIMIWRMFPEFDCVLTHVPIHESGLYRVSLNVHGHIHQNESPTSRHVNACVEWTNYTPVLLEDLVKAHREQLEETFG